jgi:predicted transcriptional regulator of viral defense system
LRRVSKVRLGDLTGPLRLGRAQESRLLRRLASAGLIARVRPGLYLVPDRLPLGGRWTPSEGLALETLLEDRGGRYQICGPNAFFRYGFADQVPNRVYCYNDRLSGDRKIGSLSLALIRVATPRLGETETVRRADGSAATYSSRVRTLVDAVYDWSRFDSLPEGFRWIRGELESARVEPGDLVRVAAQFGDISTVRRIGAQLERLGVARSRLRPLASRLRPTSGAIPWNPRRPRRGPVDSAWGVQMNDEV